MREFGMAGWRARHAQAGYRRGAAFSRVRYGARVWMRRLLMAAYLIAGLLVASDHHYLGSARLDTIEGIASAVLAVLLWPLVLLDVSMRL